MTQNEHDNAQSQNFVDTLISIGYSPVEAAEIQDRTTQLNEATGIGAWNMHARPPEITDMWERAVRFGATRLVLDISLTSTLTDEGHSRVNITETVR